MAADNRVVDLECLGGTPDTAQPAYRFKGTRYDAGDKLGFLKATVEFALKRQDLGEQFRCYLKGLKL